MVDGERPRVGGAGVVEGVQGQRAAVDRGAGGVAAAQRRHHQRRRRRSVAVDGQHAAAADVDGRPACRANVQSQDAGIEDLAGAVQVHGAVVGDFQADVLGVVLRGNLVAGAERQGGRVARDVVAHEERVAAAHVGRHAGGLVEVERPLHDAERIGGRVGLRAVELQRAGAQLEQVGRAADHAAERQVAATGYADHGAGELPAEGVAGEIHGAVDRGVDGTQGDRAAPEVRVGLGAADAFQAAVEDGVGARQAVAVNGDAFTHDVHRAVAGGAVDQQLAAQVDLDAVGRRAEGRRVGRVQRALAHVHRARTGWRR